jgi:predicted nucleotidyltransferase
MPPDADRDARDAATELSRGIAAFWRDRLGHDLLGVYLLGSLAHGGFNRRYSDIDLGVVSEIALTDDMLDAMRERARDLSPELAARISLFWADRNFTIGRFPPLDRVDYLDHAVALTEREAVRPERPSLGDIRAYLRGAPFRNWAQGAEKFAALTSLAPADHKPFLRAFLYPARLVYSWTTGGMASNDDAIALVRDAPPPDLDVDLLVRAFRVRCDAADPDSLFDDRKSLPGLVRACARMIDG